MATTTLSPDALALAQRGTMLMKAAGEDGHLSHDFHKGHRRCTMGWLAEACGSSDGTTVRWVEQQGELMEEIEAAYLEVNGEAIVFRNYAGFEASCAAMDRLLAAQPAPAPQRVDETALD
jgi:hypothetical protein